MEMKRRETEPKILCIGGNKRGSVFELSCLFGKSKTTYPDLPLNVSFHGAARANNITYCIGGLIDGCSETKRVFQMDLNEPVLKWTEIASLEEERSCFGCTVLNGKPVVAGGLGDEGSTVCYLEQTNKWKMKSSLNEGRNGIALVACDGCLYAIGGCGESTVERLSDCDREWKIVEPMKTPRGDLAAVYCGGFIYAIGGSSGHKVESSVEKYNPNENKWANVNPMNTERYGHSACVVQDKIFVVGGEDIKDKPVREIECYDPTSDIWDIVGETDIDLDGHVLIEL